MKNSNDNVQQASRITWDVIVIGTGMGGATLGHALAQAGKRVLFCERGKSHLASHEVIAGDYPEERLPRSAVEGDAEWRSLMQRGGRYVDQVIDESRTRTSNFVPFIGSGTGGSSALYGMALERFFPQDFTPRVSHPNATGTSLDDAWPVGHEALTPYYAAAERLYRVRGGGDPLRDAMHEGASDRSQPFESAGLDPQAEALFGFLQTKGLHPYRLPMACEALPDCQSCQSVLCARQCKNDAARICLAPAMENHGACLLDECAVLKIEADASKVTGLICERHGQRIRFRGKSIVLAAGALQTPNILLRSSSKEWPNGLANGSGMIGRNLMRHFIDLYLVQPENALRGEFDNRQKGFAFNDFYVTADAKLGSVQSFGRLPPAPVLLDSMRHDIAHGPLPFLAHFLPFAKPFVLPVLNRLVNGTLALATIMEDLPYLDNRVSPADGDAAPATVRITYRIRPDDEKRIELFRKAMANALKPRHWRLIKQAHNNQRIAHVCGTCRFGDDPATSVLDANNRAHELENLYVADSSFFPSSGGTNPSLTIAANALRMADAMATL